MSILFAESWENTLDNGSLAVSGWTNTANNISGGVIHTTSARTGIACLRFLYTTGAANQRGAIYRDLPANISTLRVAGGFNSANSGGAIWITIADSTTAQLALTKDATTNTLSIRRGDGTGTALATSTNTITGNTWYHVELAVEISNTVGTATVWVNGTSWATVSSADTQAGTNAYANRVYIGHHVTPTSPAATNTLLVDDLIVANNDNSQGRIGTASVKPMYATVAGTTQDWTRLVDAGASVATADNGGTISSSGAAAGQPATNGFDFDDTTYWQASASGANRWLSYDFGAAQALKGFRLSQSSGVNNKSTAYKIQASTDNSTWVDIYTYAAAAPTDSSTIAFGATYTYRYWRALTTSAPAVAWRIYILQLFDDSIGPASNVGDIGGFDSDTTYISTSTAGHVALSGLSNFTLGSDYVHAVIVKALARDDAGATTNQVQPMVRVSSTNYDGSATTTGATYIAAQSVWEENPYTSDAWSDAELDALQAGVKRV